MNIEEAILKEHSKKQTMLIVNFIGDDKARFKILMELFLKGEYRITQRASWVVSYCAITNPELVKPYFKKMIVKIKDPNIHVGVKRNIVKVFAETELPEKFYGELYDICFSYLRAIDETIAVKAHSMKVLEKICVKYPELTTELIITLEDLLPFGSSGIVARAKLIIKNLKKLSL